MKRGIYRWAPREEGFLLALCMKIYKMASRNSRNFSLRPIFLAKCTAEYFRLVFIRIYHVWEVLPALPVTLCDTPYTLHRPRYIQVSRLLPLKDGERLSTVRYPAMHFVPKLLNKLSRGNIRAINQLQKYHPCLDKEKKGALEALSFAKGTVKKKRNFSKENL